MSETGSVREGFLRALDALDAPRRSVIALSGGLDSCVLLHLARFAAGGDDHEWVAAHFDHRMRPSSSADARWVEGLCRAWAVPLHLGAAGAPPTSEEEAREARYAFLERVRRQTGAGMVLTAHHADDQAETVLFRLLRGTGGRGLKGIPSHRSPEIGRPLLGFWRDDLEAYARDVRLSWREDPTNRDPAYARNALRHRILPEVERWVAPGARRALVRLSGLAREEEEAWTSVLPTLTAPLEVREVPGGFSLLRAPLVELHPAVRARVLRALAGRLDVSLDHAATRRLVEFAAAAASGRAIDLGGALSFGIELERCILAHSVDVGEERPLRIRDRTPGTGTVVLAGSALPVSWGADEVGGHALVEDVSIGDPCFPLVVRSRRPGDRIRLPGGTKKVKKVLLERRIPPSERHGIPLVVDARGQVLWIPGVGKAERSGESDAQRLRIGIG